MTRTTDNPTKTACIINPGSARKRWLRRKRLRTYIARNLPGEKYDLLAGKEKTVLLARELCCSCDSLVAVGGDGTIADVLQGIREARREQLVTIGIVPFGSGNAFRKSLNIPRRVRKAVRVFQDGEVREVRLMEIEGVVAGFASVGATALVTQEKERHEIQGFWGHLLAGRKILRLPKWDIEAELEDGIDDRGERFSRRTLKLAVFDCVVTRSKYFGYSWKIAPLADLDDDNLDITFYETNGLKYVLTLPLLYIGLYQRTQKHFKAKRLILRGKNLPIQYHGEFLGTRDRVEARVLPYRTRFFCPRQGKSRA